MFNNHKSVDMASFKELTLDIEKLAAAIGGVDEDVAAVDKSATEEVAAIADEVTVDDKEAGVSLKTLTEAKDAMVANPKRSGDILKKYQGLSARIIDKERGKELGKNIAKIRKKGLPWDKANNTQSVIKTAGVSMSKLQSVRSALQSSGQAGTPQMARINSKLGAKKLGDRAGRLLGKGQNDMELASADKAVNTIMRGKRVKHAYIKTASLAGGVINATTALGRAATKSPYQSLVPNKAARKTLSSGARKMGAQFNRGPSALGAAASKSVDSTDKGILGLRSFARKASAETAGQKPSLGKSIRGFLARDVF